jgi:hypothetical protein
VEREVDQVEQLSIPTCLSTKWNSFAGRGWIEAGLAGNVGKVGMDKGWYRIRLVRRCVQQVDQVNRGKPKVCTRWISWHELGKRGGKGVPAKQGQQG